MNIFEALRKRYPPPAWAFMEEVRNGTGYGRVTRTCDALAMSLYPSRGLLLHGFEVKVSRGDWIKELRDPDKAEEIAKWCHFWWLAVEGEDIVRDGELPATWGLLVFNGKEFREAKSPMFNAEALAPTHKFLGAILRKFAATDTDGARLERARSEGYQAGEDAGFKRGLANTDGERWRKMYEELRVGVDKFEKDSGVSLGRYAQGNIGAIVKLIGSWENPAKSLNSLAARAAEVARICSEAALEARALLPTIQEAS